MIDLQDWLSRPSWISLLGIAGGLLLFASGLLWRKPRDRVLGILVFLLSVFGGVLLYYFG
ncbi:MAG TPA: hypothetical protein VIU38_06235 [Anaerolineales bacterium]